jgi:hypothetical protein
VVAREEEGGSVENHHAFLNCTYEAILFNILSLLLLLPVL